MYVIITDEKRGKKAMNLKENRWSIWKVLEEGNGRGK